MAHKTHNIDTTAPSMMIIPQQMGPRIKNTASHRYNPTRAHNRIRISRDGIQQLIKAYPNSRMRRVPKITLLPLEMVKVMNRVKLVRIPLWGLMWFRDREVGVLLLPRNAVTAGAVAIT
jgi:hypothetical protein